MAESQAGHPFIANPDGSYTMPRSLRHLALVISGIYHDPHGQSLPIFDENEGNPDTVIMRLGNNESRIEMILDTLWVYGSPFLNACERGEPLDKLWEAYHNAINGLSDLNSNY